MTTSSAPPPPPPEGHASEGPSRAAPSPRGSRWIDTLTTLLLVAAVCFVAVAATPALLRAAGLAPFGPSGSYRLPLRGPASEPHPTGGRLAEDDDDAANDDGDPLPGPRITPRRDSPAAEPAEEGPRVRMRPAVVRRKAMLRLEASEEADPAGKLDAGDQVFVVRESGEWVLVLQSGAGGMGWMKKSELAIR